MQEFFSDDLRYVADAILETHPFWQDIDVTSRTQAAALPEHVIEELAETYDRLMEGPGFRDLRETIKTLQANKRQDERDAALLMQQFLDLLKTLWDADVEPFALRKWNAQEIVESTMTGGDWESVAKDLQYLQGAAERYWRYASPELYDGPPQQYLSEDDMRVLRTVAKTINREGHGHRIQECQTADGLRKNRAYDKMQMLLQLLDEVHLLK